MTETPAPHPDHAPAPATDPPQWTLDDLFKGPDDPDLRDVVEGLHDRAMAFQARWRGRLTTADAPTIAQALEEYEALVVPLRRAATYANLRVTTDGSDPGRQALAMRVGEATAEAQQEVLFMELELLAIDDERAAELAAHPALADRAHYLTKLRRQRPHVLGEGEERVLTAVGPTGATAWQRLYANLTSNTRVAGPQGPRPIEVAVGDLQSPDRGLRDSSTEAIALALLDGLEVRAQIVDTLLHDKAIHDRLRGHDDWLATRNMANEVTGPQVRALVDAVSSRYDLVARWYRLKGRLMGLDHLGEHDRYAPLELGTAKASFSWEEATTLVHDAYADFSPVAADIVRRHLDGGWIDARPGEHKQPGPFCVAVPGGHPWVNLSFSGTAGDVMSLAHELGHGIHGWLQRDVPPSIFDVPLTMAETASVFGETVTHRRLAAAAPDDATTLGLLARRIDGEIATIFRQVGIFQFEDAIHRARRERGQLGVGDLNELWLDSQRAMFGDALSLGERYAHWWSYVPHIINSPGYTYAYAFGNLLSFALLERHEREGDAFVDAYLDMLARGGSAPPEELLRPLGVELGDPAVWHDGLRVFEGYIDQAEQLAASL